MEKVNAFELPVPEEKVQVIIVEEVNLPGVKVQFEIVEPDITRMLSLAKEVEVQGSIYLAGEGVAIPYGNGGYIPSEEELGLACAVFALQKDKIYKVEEILLFMKKMSRGMLSVLGVVKTMTEDYSALLMDPTPAPITAPLPSTVENQDDTGSLTNE